LEGVRWWNPNGCGGWHLSGRLVVHLVRGKVVVPLDSLENDQIVTVKVGLFDDGRGCYLFFKLELDIVNCVPRRVSLL
jgi:hypothetical protein